MPSDFGNGARARESRCVDEEETETSESQGQVMGEKRGHLVDHRSTGQRAHILQGDKGSGVKFIQRKRHDSWQDVSPKFFFVALRAPPFLTLSVTLSKRR